MRILLCIVALLAMSVPAFANGGANVNVKVVNVKARPVVKEVVKVNVNSSNSVNVRVVNRGFFVRRDVVKVNVNNGSNVNVKVVNRR